MFKRPQTKEKPMITRIKTRLFPLKVSAITALILLAPAAEALAGRLYG